MNALLLLALGLLAAVRPLFPLQEVQKEVGPYRIVAQFQEQPHVNDESILLLQVMDQRTGELVLGLADTLRMEGWVTPQTGLERRFPVYFRPAKDRPGVYEAIFVPPTVGQYRFRLTGQIEELETDMELTTGPGGLPDIMPPREELMSPGNLVAFSLLGVYLGSLVGLGAYYYLRRRGTLTSSSHRDKDKVK